MLVCLQSGHGGSFTSFPSLPFLILSPHLARTVSIHLSQHGFHLCFLCMHPQYIECRQHLGCINCPCQPASQPFQRVPTFSQFIICLNCFFCLNPNLLLFLLLVNPFQLTLYIDSLNGGLTTKQRRRSIYTRSISINKFKALLQLLFLLPCQLRTNKFAMCSQPTCHRQLLKCSLCHTEPFHTEPQ